MDAASQPMNIHEDAPSEPVDENQLGQEEVKPEA